MRITVTLLWKETRETLIYFWVGLFVFIGLPLIASIEFSLGNHTRWLVETGSFVMTCGGVLAVFIAVGATCRDLAPRLRDFWISRPVSPRRWMLIKFAVGWVIVELLTVLPLLMQSNDEHPLATNAHALLISLPFLYSAVYAIAFLAGGLLRRPAHAAMLAMAALLLIWFLPSVLNSLSWLDTTAMWDGRTSAALHARYSASMIGLTLAALVLALLTTQRDWQLASGPRLMYGSLAGAVLILFGSLSLKVGTNLPVIAERPLDENDKVIGIMMFGTSGIITAFNHGFCDSYGISVHGNDLSVNPDFSVNVDGYLFRNASTNPLPDQPDLFYTLSSDDDSENFVTTVESSTGPTTAMLYFAVVQRHGSGINRVAALWDHPWRQSSARLYLHDHRAFVVEDSKLAVFDLSDRFNPRLISQSTSNSSGRFGEFETADGLEVFLPPLPNVPAHDHLQMILDDYHWPVEGDLMCRLDYSDNRVRLAAYRLTHLEDTSATFKLVAEKAPSPIEQLFGLSAIRGIRLRNGLLYCSNYMDGYNPVVNPSISVIDPLDHFKMVGHFAAQGAGLVEPLADGRSIVAGSKVFLLGAPTKRN